MISGIIFKKNIVVFFKKLPNLLPQKTPSAAKSKKRFEIKSNKRDEPIELVSDESEIVGEFQDIYTDENYRIVIPLTKKAFEFFAAGTKWTWDTIKEQTPSITPKNTYIFIPFRNFENEHSLRFTFLDNSLIGEDNIHSIISQDFFASNPKIKVFFDRHFNVLKYTNYGKYYINHLKNGEALTESETKVIEFLKEKISSFKKIVFETDQVNTYYFDEKCVLCINSDTKFVNYRYEGFVGALSKNFGIKPNEVVSILSHVLEKELSINNYTLKPFKEYWLNKAEENYKKCLEGTLNTVTA